MNTKFNNIETFSTLANVDIFCQITNINKKKYYRNVSWTNFVSTLVERERRGQGVSRWSAHVRNTEQGTRRASIFNIHYTHVHCTDSITYPCTSQLPSHIPFLQLPTACSCCYQQLVVAVTGVNRLQLLLPTASRCCYSCQPLAVAVTAAHSL